MLAAEHILDPLPNGAPIPKHELLEINRSKISLHRSKAGYDYPTIRLPHTFSKLEELLRRDISYLRMLIKLGSLPLDKVTLHNSGCNFREYLGACKVFCAILD